MLAFTSGHSRNDLAVGTTKGRYLQSIPNRFTATASLNYTSRQQGRQVLALRDRESVALLEQDQVLAGLEGTHKQEELAGET